MQYQYIKKERGYNQSELIAREIAKNIPVIVYKNALKKIKNNKRQSDLSKEDRLDNVKNVYQIANEEIIKDKRVVLFDDIYTTGSTLNECSRLLKQNGVKEILAITLAKGQ